MPSVCLVCFPVYITICSCMYLVLNMFVYFAPLAYIVSRGYLLFLDMTNFSRIIFLHIVSVRNFLFCVFYFQLLCYSRARFFY